MARSGLTEDDGDDPLAFGRFRARVASAIRGKRGQAFLRELRDALDAMPVKALAADILANSEGDVCAIGAVGVKRGIDMSSIDPEDQGQIGTTFDISPCLAAEIAFENDEAWGKQTQEQRWERMRAWVDFRIRKTEGEKSCSS